jgi:hypothetical protein
MSLQARSEEAKRALWLRIAKNHFTGKLVALQEAVRRRGTIEVQECDGAFRQTKINK